MRSPTGFSWRRCRASPMRLFDVSPPRLGAGLVVSEMTASDDLVHGRPMSRLRCEAAGIGPHVVQLAGCETHWMAEGARIAEAAGADIIDINMGCPARHVTGGQSGSALMRDLDHARDADRGDDRGGEGAGDAEDAARLGRSLAQRAGTGAPRGSRRRADDHRARPHALPVLQGRGRLGRGARGQGRDLDSARRQRRYHLVREGRAARSRYPAPMP